MVPSPSQHAQVMQGSRWILPALCVLMAGCSSSPWTREFVYSASGVSLYHEYQETESGRVDLGYKHPIELSVKDAVLLLSQLVYKKAYLFKKPEKRYVFQPDEIRVFAPRLVLALKELAPDERLRFLVTRSNWSDVLIGTTGTSGVVFSKEENVINLAFDLVNDKFSGEDDGNPENVVFRLDPTAYRAGSPLVPRPGIRPHVDPKTGKSVDSAEPPTGEAGAGTASTTPAGAGATAVTGKESRTPEEEKQYQDLRERIETLKRLRDDGVISEEEFKDSYEKAISESVAE